MLFPSPLSPAIANKLPLVILRLILFKTFLSSYEKDRLLNSILSTFPNSIFETSFVFSALTLSKKVKILSAILVFIISKCIQYPNSLIGVKNSVAIKTKNIKLKIDILPFDIDRTAKNPEIAIPRYITPSIYPTD